MIDLSGCKVSSNVVASALSCVQSYVSSSSYQQGRFSRRLLWMPFGMLYLNRAVLCRMLILIHGLLFVLLIGILFVSRYLALFENYLAKRKKEVDLEIYESNHRGRQSGTSGVRSGPGKSESVAEASAAESIVASSCGSSSCVASTNSESGKGKSKKLLHSLSTLLGQKNLRKKSGGRRQRL